MFLQSTSRRKRKILRAAMEVDEDYNRFRAQLGKRSIPLLKMMELEIPIASDCDG
jgi:hypothetical protein